MNVLFSPCYIKGDRLYRNQKWLRYYKPLLEKLNIEKIYLYDNMSDLSDVARLEDTNVHVTRFGEFLDRKSHLDYPYWWRAMRQAAVELTDGRFDKIIHIDTDVFIMKPEVIDYINNTNTGWVSFKDHFHGFPESTFFFVNKDSFGLFKDEMLKPISDRTGLVAEDILPFTHVETKFYGGRFSERDQLPDATMYYYCQCPNEVDVNYYG